MIKEFIKIIENLGVTLQEFCYLSIIVFILSKPIKWLIDYFFRGIE